MPFWISGNIKKEKCFVSHTNVAARIFGQCYQSDTFCLPVCWLDLIRNWMFLQPANLAQVFLHLSKANGEMITKVQTTLGYATLPTENSSEFILLI
jgi:hypothetical protein